MKTFDDMYFVSLLFAYGAELDGMQNAGGKISFSFSDSKICKVFLMEDSTPVCVTDLEIKELYSYYQRRKLLYPPNFPDGRRRFLELLHAEK